MALLIDFKNAIYDVRASNLTLQILLTIFQA